MLVTGINTGDVDLFPFYGYVVGFEDGLDGLGNLGTDTVAYTNGFVSILCCIVELKSSIPGINVTVYLPPNLEGLKMSDCTVA